MFRPYSIRIWALLFRELSFSDSLGQRDADLFSHEHPNGQSNILNMWPRSSSWHANEQCFLSSAMGKKVHNKVWQQAIVRQIILLVLHGPAPNR